MIRTVTVLQDDMAEPFKFEVDLPGPEKET